MALALRYFDGSATALRPTRLGAAAKIRSMTRRFATASLGGTGVGRPSRMAAANASASTA